MYHAMSIDVGSVKWMMRCGGVWGVGSASLVPSSWNPKRPPSKG
jgi:hypothetical protein